MHTWMPLVHTHTNTHALTHIEHKSICVWICVSLELSAGISIDHLTSRWRVTDKYQTKPVWLCVCVSVCALAEKWVKRLKDRREWVSVRLCIAWPKKKEKRRKIKIRCKIGLHHRFHICKCGYAQSFLCLCKNQNDHNSWPQSSDWLSCSSAKPAALHGLQLEVKVQSSSEQWTGFSELIIKEKTSNEEHTATLYIWTFTFCSVASEIPRTENTAAPKYLNMHALYM